MTPDAAKPAEPEHDGRNQAVDALDALARGEHHAADAEVEPQADDQTQLDAASGNPMANEMTAAAEPADGQPTDPFAAYGVGGNGNDQPAFAPVARRPARASAGTAAGMRWAIPPLMVMAGLMFAIGLWAITVLLGADFLVNDPQDPSTRMKAMIMLLTIPVGIFLMFGCYVLWRDKKRPVRSGR